MKTLTTFAVGQQLKIRNFDEVKKYGIAEPFVTIHSIDSYIGFYGKFNKHSDGFVDIREEVQRGSFDCHYFGGVFQWTQSRDPSDKEIADKYRYGIKFFVEIELTPISEEIANALNNDIEFMKQNNITGFFANYEICNGGASYKNMSIDDAVFIPVVKNGTYIGFSIANLSNFNTVNIENLREAAKKNGKHTVEREEPIGAGEENMRCPGHDRFWYGIIAGDPVKTSDSGYSSSW